MEKIGIGVDVGGTGITLGMFREDGTLIKTAVTARRSSSVWDSGFRARCSRPAMWK